VLYEMASDNVDSRLTLDYEIYADGAHCPRSSARAAQGASARRHAAANSS
jgi:hypothetical protein